MSDIICPICGFTCENLTSHIKSHGFSIPEFRKEFPSFGYLKSDRLRLNQSQFMTRFNPMSGVIRDEITRQKISANRFGKGLGVAGKYIRTNEIRDKISRGVAKAYLEGRAHTYSSNGIWLYSEKNKKRMWLASSYEVRVFNVLERNEFFLSFEREPLAIPYEWEGKIKHYIPDFMVKTLGNIKELWEIKPKFQMKYPINIRKQKLLSEFSSENDLNACWLNEDHIKSFEKTIHGN